jgi:transcriptional regulator with XRE-family HTH domain
MTRRRKNGSTQFAGALRRYRLAADLSQAALANRAGTSPSLIALLELGQREPRRDKVIAIARALALRPRERDYLLQRAGLAPISTEPASDSGSLGRTIADLLADPRLSPRQRLIGEALVEAFARWLRAELATGGLNLLLPRKARPSR